ncbi:PREDICTED: snurportin-1 [Ceratosolen solmsi marchali]|uniref:Snurportin-1 n=1 Tax=Ceratosolen solmsi marchali TaxID=326594 RepID=A0AAJ7E0E9_9HYME|nr:PREDICTED: snurportin-1 [Ceratosolen solmsi marchali]
MENLKMPSAFDVENVNIAPVFDMKSVKDMEGNNFSKKTHFNERLTFYKKQIKKNNHRLDIDFVDTPQEIRRQQMLDYQKQNRYKCLNESRGLLDVIFNLNVEKKMEVEEVPKSKCKPHKEYKNLLMLSEWMLEVPQDFTENWIMVPCPLGKRVMIIASRGITKMYTRRGFQLSVCRTALPGGSKQTYDNDYVLLDGIWLENKKICYVLDVLVWSKQDMINCECQFRFFWLNSQLKEIEQLKEQIAGVNDYKILTLPNIACDNNFYDCLESISTTIALDGLLFYHRRGHYIRGVTPLVNWLKTYMLPEILGMNVPEPYDEKPSTYINFEHHVQKITSLNKAKKEKLQKNKKQLQCEQIEEDMN